MVCAKPEELRSVKTQLDENFDRVAGSAGSAIFTYEIQPTSNADPLRIFATSCTDMGHLPAAVRTIDVTTQYQPRLVLFVGTAASMDPRKLQIGDVVIPKKAINRIYTKVSEKGQRDYDDRMNGGQFAETLLPDTALISDIGMEDTTATAGDIIAAVNINALSLQKPQGTEIKIGDDLAIEIREPRVHDDVDIFSCGMVVDSLNYRNFLRKLADTNLRKATAIDMESYGFFNALKVSRASGVGNVADGIMVRGISDYAGRKQQGEELPGNRKVAAVENAAIVATAIIKGYAEAC